MTRRKRNRRGPKRNVRATDRLLSCLLGLRAFGAARTSDLEILLDFPSRSSANKWLRRVFDAGLILAHVGELHAENSYTLTQAGWTYLVEHLDGVDAGGAPARVTPTEHRLLRAAFWVRLAAGVHATGRDFLAWPEEELRSLGPNIVPDLVVSRDASERALHAWCVEVDTGTESAKTIRSKAKRYAAYLDGNTFLGCVVAAVIWVATSKSRAKVLERAVAPSGAMSELHRFIDIDELCVENAVERVFKNHG